MVIILVTSVIVGLVCRSRSRALYGFEEIRNTSDSHQPYNEDPAVMKRTLLEDMEDG